MYNFFLFAILYHGLKPTANEYSSKGDEFLYLEIVTNVKPEFALSHSRKTLYGTQQYSQDKASLVTMI